MLTEVWQMLSRLMFLALQVINTGSFPRPLKAAEEQQALVDYHEHGDRQARGRLIEHNLRLVAHIVKKYHNSTQEQDDLISIGTIGLMKAVDTFDHTKGVRLATYASRCVENEILMFFRANKRTAQELSLTEPIDTDREGHSLTLMDVIADEDTIADDLDMKVNGGNLRRYMDEVLTVREKEILSLRFGLSGEPLTQKTIAKRYGISRSYVSRIETKALNKLYVRFEQGDVQKKG